MSHTVVDDFDRFGFTRHAHELLSTSSAVAPALALVSAPQATFQVTTLDDVVDANDGVLSLREAITLANDTPGRDTITFADDLRGGTIELSLGTLSITDDLVLDGDPLNRGPGGIILDGVAGYYSGALTVLNIDGAELQASDLTITGGLLGISASDTDMGLERVAITGNDSVSGGLGGGFGISVRDSILTIDDSSIARNVGGLEGGFGLSFSNSDVLISNSSISDNGGFSSQGIVGRDGVLLVTNSLINANAGFTSSFGIELQDVNLLIQNSTLASNGNNAYGGYSEADGAALSFGRPGFYSSGIGTAFIFNSTITGNTSAIQAGADSSIFLRNSIIDGKLETVLTGGQIISGLDFQSNGANIFSDISAMEFSSGARPGDRLASADDLFAMVGDLPTGVRGGLLADNGGPTQTVALKNSATNPAIDAADPADAPLLDQRGFARDAAPDIGAFELGATALPPPPPPALPLPDLGEKVPLADADILGAPRSFLTLVAGDAAISFVDEFAAFQNSLGVYLIGPDGEIASTAWAFNRIEHAEPSDLASSAARPGGGPLSPGDAVFLSDLFDPSELAPGTEFGLFLVADGAALNPFVVFDGGTLEFRTGDTEAQVTDRTPQLFHIAENLVERAVAGDIMHTVDAGSPNPLSNTLNPGGRGQVTSGILDGQFTVAFEDKPLAKSDRDFNDALFAIDLLDDAPVLFAAQASGAETVGAVASLETLLITAETVA